MWKVKGQLKAHGRFIEFNTVSFTIDHRPLRYNFNNMQKLLVPELIINFTIGASRPPVLDCGATFHPGCGGRDCSSTSLDNMFRLFNRIQSSFHCLSHLLPPEKHHLGLRFRGHRYTLPICPNELCKSSFISRSLFSFLRFFFIYSV